MFIRNFDVPENQEQINMGQFIEIALMPGNIGKCLKTLEEMKKKELAKIILLLPESNPIRQSAIDRFQKF